MFYAYLDFKTTPTLIPPFVKGARPTYPPFGKGGKGDYAVL